MGPSSDSLDARTTPDELRPARTFRRARPARSRKGTPVLTSPALASSAPTSAPLAEPSTAWAPSPPRDPSTQVELLAWSGDARRREQLRAFALPRILLLEPDAEPPLVWDDLEDWVREPVDAEELAARCERVRSAAASARSTDGARLAVDAAGAVHLDGRTVQVGAAAAPVLAALVQRLDRPVRREHLAALVPDGLLPGGLDALLAGLRRAVRPLGVRIEVAGADALVCFVIGAEEGAR